ncbi:MAG TPA: hypothetical protein VE760_03890 [Acidimicrobiales bacterium]|nr:hypothetical protein [Acidimicrobiales bacterium]
MVRQSTRSWPLLVAAVLAAGLGFGAATVGPGDGWPTGGRRAPTSLAAPPLAPFDAIVPADASRALVGRLGNPLASPRAGLLAVVLSELLLLPALGPAFGLARLRPRSPWESPGRRSVAPRAPPRSRLV